MQKQSRFFLLTNFLFLNILSQHNLVDIQKFIPSAIIDIKYATKDNFTNTIVYKFKKESTAYLAETPTKALAEAAKEFDKMGYKIKIWDSYRPHKHQFDFWKLVPDERYVADPIKGSRHNRGAAIDLTLVDKDGNEVDMGTAFDDFSEKAHRNYKNLPEQVLKNRKILEEVMQKNKFCGLPTEWWHYDYIGNVKDNKPEWESYPILDISFEELEK